MVPDELDVQVPREARGHDEGPGAPHHPHGVGHNTARAEIDLNRLTGREVETDGDLRRRFPLQDSQQASD